MSGVIRSHHEHVTRIMGDGIMSVFGALHPNPWHAQDAVEAALDMRKALDPYNEMPRARKLPELSFGIGIQCGSTVAGLVGSTAGMGASSRCRPCLPLPFEASRTQCSRGL